MVQIIDAAFAHLSAQIGMPADHIKLFFLLLLSYPLSAALPSLAPTQKHIANILVSTFFLAGVLNLYSGYLQLLGTSLATYAICYFKIGGKKMPWVIFWLQMGHLTINHLQRALFDIPLSTIEITAMQMVLCMNLTSFAWSVYDGQMRPEAACDSQQLSMRVAKMPSVLEFLGYAFYFPGVLIGPSTRFVDYVAWANGQLYLSTKGKERERLSPSASIPAPPDGRFKAAVKDLVIGLTFMGIFAVYGGAYGYERLIASPLAGGVSLWPFFKRVAFCQVAGFMARTKYYGIWSLTNGACIMSGLGYNGVVQRPGANGQLQTKTRWNRCQNIDILNIEFANNWKELLDSWNMNTNVWLRNNVYKRIARPGSKPGFKSTMMTFATSAFWHGIAPGYYLTFLLGGFSQSLARSLRRHLRPIFFSDPRAANPSVKTIGNFSIGQLFYTSLSILAVQLSLNFTVIPFMLLDFDASIKAWNVLRWYSVVGTLGGMLFFRLGGGKSIDKLTGRVAGTKSAPTSAASGDESEAGGNVSRRKGPALQVPDVDIAEKAALEALTDEPAQKATVKKEL